MKRSSPLFSAAWDCCSLFAKLRGIVVVPGTGSMKDGLALVIFGVELELLLPDAIFHQRKCAAYA